MTAQRGKICIVVDVGIPMIFVGSNIRVHSPRQLLRSLDRVDPLALAPLRSLAPLSRPIAKSLFCGEGSFSLNESAIKRRWRWGWCVCMGAGGPHCASKSATIPSFYSFLCCLIGVCGAAVSPRSFGHGHLLCVSFVSRLAADTCFLAPFKNLIFENATLWGHP